MHYIVKLFPEITIKSPPVRKRLTRQVRNNLRTIFKKLDARIDVQRDWEKLEVKIPGGLDELVPQVEEVMANTPGINQFSRVKAMPYSDLEDICQKVSPLWAKALRGKSFCVRVKRSGQQSFRSIDVERHLGAVLLAAEPDSTVNLSNPDITVALEVRGDQLFVVERTFPGIGGYPLGSQHGVLSMISGGYDSTVASYMTLRRGLMTHYCFFNLGGDAHELGVKEVAHYLWQRYGSSHRVRFVTVPFEGVVSEILNNVSNAYMGVVLKRMMFRAANKVARQLNLDVLVSGESVAQVSSQTLPNLVNINEVAELLTLRPLAVMDKEDIIKIAREIGTEAFAASMPEYCGVISVKPTTNAKPERVIAEEAGFDMAVLDAALGRMKIENIDSLLENAIPPETASVAIYQTPQPGSVIVDIRHPDEVERSKLQVGNTETVQIPFFQLDKAASGFDGSRKYLLYCEKGVMSRLHAELLYKQGYDNIGVYRPAK